MREELIGGGVVTAVIQFCKLAEICKTEKPAVGYSVKQEINKTGTLPRGLTEVAISTKLKLQQQNWNFTT